MILFLESESPCGDRGFMLNLQLTAVSVIGVS